VVAILIGVIGFAQVGARSLALAAFGVGIFFWTVLAAVVACGIGAARITTRESAPAPAAVRE
jgi:hypothetical protein